MGNNVQVDSWEGAIFVLQPYRKIIDRVNHALDSIIAGSIVDKVVRRTNTCQFVLLQGSWSVILQRRNQSIDDEYCTEDMRCERKCNAIAWGKSYDFGIETLVAIVTSTTLVAICLEWNHRILCDQVASDVFVIVRLVLAHFRRGVNIVQRLSDSVKQPVFVWTIHDVLRSRWCCCRNAVGSAVKAAAFSRVAASNLGHYVTNKICAQ